MREKKLVGFSRDTNREELNIGKTVILCSGFVAMASLQ